MALETLRGVTQINGVEIVDICELKDRTLDKMKLEEEKKEVTLEGEAWYKFFEREVRPHKFIYVRHDVNSLSFNIQNGPIKEFGVNGCQVTDIIAVAKHIFEELNKKFPCRENAMTITHLDEALLWQIKRTMDRQARGVEGLSKA